MRGQQKGFTFLEMLLVIGIVGVVVVAISMATTNLLINSERVRERQILLQQIQNAGYQFSRDIQMSSNVTLGTPNGFPVSIVIPVDQDLNNDYDVEYLLVSDELKRKQYDSSGNLTSENLITAYVDVSNSTCDNISEGSYLLSMRVSLGEESVTSSYEARQRLATDPE